jgi:hypothetical protein
VNTPSTPSRRRAKVALRTLLTALLGVAAALLIACGSSSTKQLIPLANAGPLQSDIDAVEAAAESGEGNCGQTETALLKLDQDYQALPEAVSSGLRGNVRQGIQNLRKVALELCAQPLAGATGTTTTQTTTTTETTPPPETTETTPPETEPTEQEAENPGEVGGTPAPGETGGAPGEGTPGPGGEEANQEAPK